MFHVLRRFITKVLFVALAGWLGFAAFLYVRQESFIFQPKRAQTVPPADLAVTAQRLGSIEVWDVPAAEGKPTVLFLHGNGGNLTDTIPTMKAWQSQGYGVVAFDYQGYGVSSGKPTIKNTIADSESVIRWMIATKGIPESQIVVHGHSLGGGLAIETARSHPQLRALVLESTFTTLEDIAVDITGPIYPYKYLLKGRLDSSTTIQTIAPPVVLVHGEADLNLPIKHAQELAMVMKCGETKWFPGLVHENVFSTASAEIMPLVDAAVSKCATAPAAPAEPAVDAAADPAATPTSIGA